MNVQVAQAHLNIYLTRQSISVLVLSSPAQDYAFIENTKFKLCQFWAQHGQSLNMGIGLYSSGQIHIDTQGYRTWGPDLTRNSSMYF